MFIFKIYIGNELANELQQRSTDDYYAIKPILDNHIERLKTLSIH